jgi:hypothetical protein
MTNGTAPPPENNLLFKLSRGCINPGTGYFSGPRTPDGAATICSPGPALPDRISE